MVKTMKSNGFWSKPRKVFAFSKYDIDWIPNAVLSTYKEADFIVMPGGADWNPAIYGEACCDMTSYYRETDEKQLKVFISAVLDGKFIIGICRGAQLCCIGAGGSLIQHVSNHNRGDHKMICEDGMTRYTNSLHHQMLNLTTISNYHDCVDMIAHADALSTTYLNGKNMQLAIGDKEYRAVRIKEPEVVFFHKIRAFGIQGHPEMHMAKETIEYILDKIEEAYISSSYQNVWKNYGQIASRLRQMLFVYRNLETYFDNTMITNWENEMNGVDKLALPSKLIINQKYTKVEDIVDEVEVETINETIQQQDNEEKDWRVNTQGSRWLD